MVGVELAATRVQQPTKSSSFDGRDRHCLPIARESPP
jgi:hypothetical protein